MSGRADSETGSEQTLDGSTLRDLTAMGGREFAEELVAVFVRETPPRLSDLRASLAAQNLQAVRRVAHALYGGAGQLGASAFASTARQMELGAAQGQAGPLTPLMQRLEHHATQLMLALEAWVRTPDVEHGGPR